MAKTRAQKEQTLKDINQKIKDSNMVIFCVFDKLPVNKDRELRVKLRKNEVEYTVVKKTLLKKSFEANKINNWPEGELRGNISMSLSQDEVAGPKILAKFAQEKEDFKIIGGFLNHVWVEASQIAELAKLPAKLELLGRIVTVIKVPLNGLVNVLIGNVRGLVNVVNTIKNQKNH